MAFMGRACVLWVLLGMLAACGGGGGSSPAPPTAGPPAASTAFEIASAEAGITYGVQVWLPAGYEAAGAPLPAVYAMDSEYRFATLTAVLQATGRRAILVNVAAMSSARRYVDFTMPGAEAYYRFLTRELIPFVEARWRIDGAKRTLSGHSLSGQFALYALYLERPDARFFSSFVSGDGSFWYTPDGRYVPALEDPVRMEQAMRDRSRQLPVSLVIAGNGAPGNGPQGAQLHDFLAQRGYEGLRLANLNYNSGHVAMDGPSFGDALDFIYGPAR